MPRYDYECSSCGEVQTHQCAWDVSSHPKACPCGGIAEKLFPVQAAFGIEIQTPYYDESLGMDISGKREKKQVLSAMGLKEAGDKVRGARDFDKHAPMHIKPLPPRGIRLSDVQKSKENAAKRKAATRFYAESNGKIRRVTPQTVNKNKFIHVKTQ
jgi:putative FmdB family regulatory protein